MSDKETKKPRIYVKQSDVPGVSLQEALRVPQAIADNYAKSPTKPLDVAKAMGMTPTSGTFRNLCGAALGYGLTEGGAQSNAISLSDLGRRIVAPIVEGDELVARREAVLQPRVIREFLEKYNLNPLPTSTIAKNVLETMGIPEASASKMLEIIIANAEAVGFLSVAGSKRFVDLHPGQPAVKANLPTIDPSSINGNVTIEIDESDSIDKDSDDAAFAPIPNPKLLNRRVFISHGRNRRIVDQLKELLAFGDFEAVVSVERESVSKPVPDKVMDDMRSCSAGIIHVSADERLLDKEGNERVVLNPNVLIEIGGAMALYVNRFILLVEEGVSLPSNLQGLYQVRYSGDELGYDGTMKVLKALNSFKEPSIKGA